MFKKYIFSALLFAILATSLPASAMCVFQQFSPKPNEIIFNQVTRNISVINPSCSNNAANCRFPGMRGTNQLVVYTPEYGRRTNTNEFGTEALIIDGIVTQLSGANTLIPANGVVISGHGQAKQWIHENIIVGSKVYIDSQNKTITSYITSDTFLYSAKAKLVEVQNIMNYYLRTTPKYDARKTITAINKSKDYIAKAEKDCNNVQKFSGKAVESANEALSLVLPYKHNELKGVWIRPTYHSKNEIENVLDNLKKTGIDTVFVETFYHGKTIFPSDIMLSYGFIEQNEEFVGFDPLEVWIKEAHKRNIKVHIWFETFYVGNKNPKNYKNHILSIRPNWTNLPKNSADSIEPVYSSSEHNGYFLDPANPEVQNFLIKLLSEIITKYNPDGINLDYIRYPQAINPEIPGYENSTWGYTSYSREGFKSKYEIDPIELTRKDLLWDDWLLFRADRVTDFVRRASELCKEKQVPLTAVIFPNQKGALVTKLQDWRSWSKSDYVDGFTPLFLTCDPKTTASMIAEVNNNKSKTTKLYGGLFVTFMKGNPEDLIRILHESRRFGLSGAIIFDYAHFGHEYMNILTASAFNNGSISRVEVTEPAVKTPLSSICTKCRPNKKCKECKKLEKRKQKEKKKRTLTKTTQEADVNS